MWAPFLLSLLTFHSFATASPAKGSKAVLPAPVTSITSFIALGESYAAGVGAGVADHSVFISRCLRCNQAYPRVLARDSTLEGKPDESRLINNVCSGQVIPDILKSQFGDRDSWSFRAFGKPQFATISAAGDDIFFKELVLSCIYEFPYKPKKCQAQIQQSTDVLNSPAFAQSITKLIQTTLDKGLANHKDFRIYYPGYAQFFNTKTTTPDYCSQRTWSLCKWWQWGCEKLPISIKLRQQLNFLATTLNQRIETSVKSFANNYKDTNGKPLVKYIDIDILAEGHRYCEQGKIEPVNNDDNIWFFQWLDDETRNDAAKKEFYDKVAQSFPHNADDAGFSRNEIQSSESISANDWLEHEIQVAKANPQLGLSINIEGAITNRVKSFHPKIKYHQLIEQKISAQVKQDFESVVKPIVATE